MKLKVLKKIPYLLSASLLVLALALAACENGLAPGDEETTPTPGITEATPTPGVPDEATPGVPDEATPGVPDETGMAPILEVAEHPELGQILTDGQGMTLYILDADQQGPSTCYDACAELWPPFLANEEPVIGMGEGLDEALVGTVMRDDGQMQVTYNDWPLYYFNADIEPGDVVGHQVQDMWGLWLAIAPDGEPIGQGGLMGQ